MSILGLLLGSACAGQAVAPSSTIAFRDYASGNATSGALLLYTSQNTGGSSAEVFVFSYPQGASCRRSIFPSVDPTTGNLAVANMDSVAIFPKGGGTPSIYELAGGQAFDCAYDPSGGLFIDGSAYTNKIFESPAGGNAFFAITLNETWLHFTCNGGTGAWPC